MKNQLWILFILCNSSSDNNLYNLYLASQKVVVLFNLVTGMVSSHSKGRITLGIIPSSMAKIHFKDLSDVIKLTKSNMNTIKLSILDRIIRYERI